MGAVAAAEVDQRKFRAALRMHQRVPARHFRRNENDVVILRSAERKCLSRQGKMTIPDIEPGSERRRCSIHSQELSRICARGLPRGIPPAFYAVLMHTNFVPDDQPEAEDTM